MRIDYQGMKVRLFSSGEEIPIDMRTVWDWISAGKLTENDEVNGSILTDGHWKRLGDTRFFYMARDQVPPEPLSAEPLPDYLMPSSPDAPYDPGPLTGSGVAVAALRGMEALLCLVVAVSMVLASNSHLHRHGDAAGAAIGVIVLFFLPCTVAFLGLMLRHLWAKPMIIVMDCIWALILFGNYGAFSIPLLALIGVEVALVLSGPLFENEPRISRR